MSHYFALLLLFVCTTEYAAGRARMVEPPMRSSLWREGDLQVPVNYLDELLNCGGFQEQWRNAGGKCGACGDPYNDLTKPNEYPGIYSRHKPIRTLLKGGFLNITIYTKPNMLGYFEFRLCPEQDSPKLVDLQSCFDRYPLIILETNYTKYFPGSRGGFHDMHALLPKSVTCDRCVIQWKYVTGYRYGWNPDSCGQCLGCGPQETYINCADVSIVNNIPGRSHDHSDDTGDHNISNNGILIFPNISLMFFTQLPSSVTSPSSLTDELTTTSTTSSSTTRQAFGAEPATTTLSTTISPTLWKPATTATTETQKTASATRTTPLGTTKILTLSKSTASTLSTPDFVTDSTTRPSYPDCTSFYPNITCEPRGLQKFVPGMRLWCSYQCSTGTCPYIYCECFCVYPNGTKVYLQNPRRPITPMVKFHQFADMCFGPVDAFKDTPGMGHWCQQNCPGFSCFSICERVDCQ